jgi:hypothetical protein
MEAEKEGPIIELSSSDNDTPKPNVNEEKKKKKMKVLRKDKTQLLLKNFFDAKIENYFSTTKQSSLPAQVIDNYFSIQHIIDDWLFY